MNEPHQPQPPRTPYVPPIAEPQGQSRSPLRPANNGIRGDFQTAPAAVKVARTIAFINLGVGVLAFVFAFVAGMIPVARPDQAIPMMVFGGFFFIMGRWLSSGHYEGQRAAWYGQLVLSIFCLLMITKFSLVGALNVAMLFGWFSSDVKAWFELD